MSELPISALPESLDDLATIEAAYRDDLNWIQDKLQQGVSVLVECEKQLTLHLYVALRTRLRQANSEQRLNLLSGHAQPGESASPMQTLMQRLLLQLQAAVLSGAENEILVLPHLDILTTTTRSGLSAETREAAAMLYENPACVFLGFKDPSFELAPVIENVFPVKRQLIGIPRDRLPALVCQREARKFGSDTFNPYLLYKYVSGLNAIRLREILSYFADRLDFTPSNPAARDEIIREIREMTLLSTVELPNVDLESDIGGYAKVKERIQKDILDLLAAKDRAETADEVQRLEELIPKGMILHGPPGTGKTFFAKAIATALDATLTVVSGPELKSKWVGESEENLRHVFAQARRAAPSIIVFDELDSFAAARGMYAGSGVEHSMVNQMLTEMDGFRKEEMVFVIGTTNFLESIDSALLRPGRFEQCIEIPAPNDKDRKEIIQIYEKRFGITLEDEVREHAVQRTSGVVDELNYLRYTGDHLYAMMRALKREELRRGEGPIKATNEDIDKALSRSDRSKVSLQKQEEVTIAVHESGHAVLAYVLPDCPTIKKVTVATGEEDTLGYVMQAVRKNKYVTTQEELLDDICVLLGGREAERLLIGKVSGGAYSDLQRANELARVMVEELGMSEQLGALTVPQPTPRNACSQGETRHVSDETARSVDLARKEILDQQQVRAQELLTQYQAELTNMRDTLLEKKTLNLKQIKELFSGREFPKSDPGELEEESSKP